VTAKYTIKDTFKITGRGLVLAGHIDEGVIYIGDFIEFNALDKKRKRKITGIEGIRKANPDKANTGLLIKCEDENEIDELRTWRPDNEVGLIFKE
jgi:translation elongation factor EF-Tu-like GTPase